MTVINALASSSIIKAKSTAEYDYIVGDAGNIYKDTNLTRFYRHFIYIKPDIIVIVDELESTASTSIEWRMHKAATAAFTGSGSSYVVSNANARMDVHFVNPSGLTTSVGSDVLSANLTSTGSDLLVTVLHPRKNTDPAATSVLVSLIGSVIELDIGAGLREMTVLIDTANQELSILEDTAAGAPTPADRSVAIDVNEDVSWTAGSGATSHDVYFGTNPLPGPAEFKGNQTGTNFDPGTLDNAVTYYWRIDEHNPSGTITGPVWSFTTEAVEAGLWELIEQRLSNSINEFTTNPTYNDANYPRSTNENGLWKPLSEGHWASGFWPGSFWYLYGRTGQQQWKDWAVEWTTPLKRHEDRTNDHESGFIIYRSFGLGYHITADANYKPVIIKATESLLTRFDPDVGCIRSWNSYTFPVITDGLMMLDMVFWAAKNGGDPAWYDIAVSHAEKTMENNVRADGSVWQIVDYNSVTGDVIGKYNKQGYDNDSTWSRGQAWGISGFTLAYRETGDIRFLETAKRCADYFIDNLPADLVPYWDFDAPGIPDEPRDSSAAAIAASGLLELSTYVADKRDKDRYFNAACDILDSLASPDYLAAEPNMSILLHGTGRGNPDNPDPSTWEIDCGLIYSDHFFIEALVREEQIIEP
jgi:unsaturated chondroitin disaccharide hydrolase